MKDRVKAGLCLIITTVLFFAGSVASAKAVRPESGLTFTTGTRTDDFDWNKAHPTGTPNILSELTWEDLEIYQLKVRGRTYSNGFYVRGSLAYGLIYDGRNQDSDYNGNNRTLEFSRSNNSGDDGDVWDASLGVGWYIFKRRAFEAIPMFGFSVHKQNLTMTDGYQTICVAPSCTGSVGPFAGLDSTYDALWYGPWVGLDLSYVTANEKLILYGTFEVHVAIYRAEADWNLRSDLKHPVSFEHEANNATGVVISAGLDYALDGRWSISSGVELQNWQANNGTDRMLFANGAVSTMRLNEVNWTSTALTLGFKYSY